MGCAPKRILRLGGTEGCDMCPQTLTPRMKHTRGCQTVRRDVFAACYRNDVDSKPPHFFEAESGIRSPNRIEDRKKKPNGSNRKSNRLAKKKILHTLYHTELLLGLIDVVQCLHFSYESSLLTKTTMPWK